MWVSSPRGVSCSLSFFPVPCPPLPLDPWPRVCADCSDICSEQPSQPLLDLERLHSAPPRPPLRLPAEAPHRAGAGRAVSVELTAGHSPCLPAALTDPPEVRGISAACFWGPREGSTLCRG